MEIEPPDSLYGLYQGTPLPERTWAFGNALPDRITLFQRPIEEDCEDEDEIRAVIGETLIHEVGHYFGLSEEEIEEIEERYWRGETLTPDEDSGQGVRPKPGNARGDTSTSPRGTPSAARKRFGQHFLEPPWVDKLIAALGPRRTTRSSKSAPAVARSPAARAPRVARSSRWKSTATWPRRCPSRFPPTCASSQGDFLDVDLESCWRDEPRPVAGRRQPPLQRCLAHPLPAAGTRRARDDVSATRR